MEFKYIFAIVVLGVFFLLIFISFAVLERGRVKDEKLQAWISEMYRSKKVTEYDYDAEQVEDIAPQPVAAVVNEETNAVEEVADEEPVEDPYAKIDIEGIEEITGNYNG